MNENTKKGQHSIVAVEWKEKERVDRRRESGEREWTGLYLKRCVWEILNGG